jgi:hypothetical protein
MRSDLFRIYLQPPVRMSHFMTSNFLKSFFNNTFISITASKLYLNKEYMNRYSFGTHVANFAMLFIHRSFHIFSRTITYTMYIQFQLVYHQGQVILASRFAKYVPCPLCPLFTLLLNGRTASRIMLIYYIIFLMR